VGGVRDLMVGEPRAIAGFDLYQNGIVAPRDPEVLASAVLYLLANPELCSAMGQAGKEFVRHRYTYQRLADDLEAIYREIGLAKAVLSQEACLTLVAAGRKE
jgi:glycosyltransferase involved in cell wall biosynthesis